MVVPVPADCGAGGVRDDGVAGGSVPGPTGSGAGRAGRAGRRPRAGSGRRQGRPKIVFLGDSLTAGLGLLETQAFPALLQQRIDADGYTFEVVNAGVSGDTSAGGLRRLDWALDGDVRVLVLALGANDGLRGLPVAEMKHNLAQIIDERARAQHRTVILAGMEAPPNYGPEYTTAFRAGVPRLAPARTRRCSCRSSSTGSPAHPALNQADGIHPNPQGAQIVADTVWRSLEPLLEQMSRPHDRAARRLARPCRAAAGRSPSCIRST